MRCKDITNLVSVAVTKHLDPGHVEKEGFIWAHSSRERKVPLQDGSRHGGWNSKLRSHILNRKHGVERANGKWQIFKTSKPASSDILLPKDHMPCVSPVPLTGDEVLEC